MVSMHFKIFCAFLALGVFGCFAEQGFVVEKKKKSSTSALQEQCCQSLTDVLQGSAYTVQAIGKLQEQSIEIMEQMFDNSFFTGLSKTELNKAVEAWQSFAQRQDEINALLGQQEVFLKKQKQKRKS